MSFIQETIRCKICKFEMNVSTGTFGSGLPRECPNCPWLPFDYEVISDGWNAKQVQDINKQP